MFKHYKINYNTVTGTKITKLFDNDILFYECTALLKSKYGFKNVMKSPSKLFGLNGVTFDEEPDMTKWKIIDKIQMIYYPRAKCKEMCKDFEHAKQYEKYRHELNDLVGNTSIFTDAGIKFHVDFCVVTCDDTYIPNNDMERISDIEMESLNLRKSYL